MFGRSIITTTIILWALAATSCSAPPTAPASASDTPEIIRTGERLHVVRRGETFSSIARHYDLSAQVLTERNRSIPPEALEVGSEIVIPPHKPEVRRIEPAAATSQ